jgi:hypothetical protein
MSVGVLAMLWAAAAVCGLAASVVYLINAPSREAIDRALEIPSGPRSEVGMFTVCKRGDAEDWSAYSLVPPERALCYGPNYLAAFRNRASQARTSFGDTALQRYIRPVLMWNDIAFAVLTALFAVLVNIAISQIVPYPSLQTALLWLAAAGLAYGIADVLEDATLVKLLQSPSPISTSEAAISRTLTLIKMLTLFVSLSGGILFASLMAARAAYKKSS